MSLHFRPAVEIATEVNEGERTARDVIAAHLDRIDERGSLTNAFVTILEDEALVRAGEVDEALADGADLPLAGLPVGIKDLGTTKAGVRHTLGMAPLSENVATETSTIVRRLEDAGAIVVGTTNTPALGHRARTDNRLVGPTATPFDLDRNAGGSSGGSAAALADGLCALAIGSDLGGSLRNPAACCSVVAVKPTFGVVPRDTRPNAYGGYSPFSVWGPMARDVRSLARLLDVIAGRTPRDPTSVPVRGTYEDVVESPPKLDDVSVAYSPDLGCFAVEPVVREAVESTLEALAMAGARIEAVTIDPPPYDELVAAYTNTVTPHTALTFERLEEALGMDLLGEHADRIPDQLAGLVAMGRDVELQEFLRADRVRTELYEVIDDVLGRYDAVACPVLATPPLTHDEPLPTEIDGEPVSGITADWTLAWPFNLTGHPAVAVPGEPADSLPIGLQLVGRPHAEQRLLELAAAIESCTPWTYPGA